MGLQLPSCKRTQLRKASQIKHETHHQPLTAYRALRNETSNETV
jgi:hypothetical protein